MHAMCVRVRACVCVCVGCKVMGKKILWYYYYKILGTTKYSVKK